MWTVTLKSGVAELKERTAESFEKQRKSELHTMELHLLSHMG